MHLRVFFNPRIALLKALKKQFAEQRRDWKKIRELRLQLKHLDEKNQRKPLKSMFDWKKRELARQTEPDKAAAVHP